MIRNCKKESVNLAGSINLIPMINLVFLLLIFFLLTGVIQKKDDPEIIIPESELGIKKNNLKNQLIIRVNSEGLLKINEEKISVNEIKSLRLNKDDMIILNIDKNITIKKTNEFFKIFKSMGLEKIHINVLDRNDKI